jgi:iron complex outermembrane recepter protein
VIFQCRRLESVAVIIGLGVILTSKLCAQQPEPTPGIASASEQVGATAEVERVIVTGSNIPTAEEVGPTPVDTYRAEDIQKLGVRTPTELTEKLPAITGFAVNENISNGGDGRTEVNLRGLFPKETLVLVDGKRVAPVGFAMGASVDLNLIPFALVDHIDILKDGASAIYGSDAIGGVFNIFLKHKFRGLELEASYGNTNLGASNDAAEREGHLLAGVGDDKTDIVVFAEYYGRAAIFSRDRFLSSNANLDRFGGADTRSGNFAGRLGDRFLRVVPHLDKQGVPVPGQFDVVPGREAVLDPARVVPTNVPGTHPFALPPQTDLPMALSEPAANTFVGNANAGLTAAGYVRRTPALDNGTNGTFLFNFAALTSAISPADRQYFYGSFNRELCDKYLEVFADFKFVRTFFDPVLAPVPFAPDPFKQADGVTPVSPGGISVPLSNPFNPFSTAQATLPDGTPVITGVRYRELAAGARTFKTTTNDYLFDAGLRGTLGKFGDYFKTWNYEIGFRYNSNDHGDLSSGIVSKPGLREALLDTNPATAFNPFGRNVNTAAALDRVLITLHDRGVATLTDESAALNGDLFKLPAGPLSFALGSEHRKETVNEHPDSLNTTFSTIGAVDLEATRGSRDVWSYYGELRIPVASPTWNFRGAYSLEFQVAERFEFYSDTDTAERPKFSVRYQPFDSSLTLRASYTEAFHAPNLSDLAPSAAETFSDVFDPAHMVVDPDTGKSGPEEVLPRTLQGGQPNLRPEVAYGWNYGLVWTPKFLHGLTLSVDYYHIDLRDRTNFIEPQFIVSQNYATRTGLLPNGSPIGGRFADLIVRDPVTGEILLIRDLIQNISRTITEGIDYEAVYAFDTSILGRGNLGIFTFTLNGNYLSRYVAAINIGDHEREYAGQDTFFGGYLLHNRLYMSAFYDLGGLDTGVTVHYFGQGREAAAFPATFGLPPRKIREWTTVDTIISYTFNLATPVGENQVAGYAKDGGKSVTTKDGDNKNLLPRSTAAYTECGWRAWLNRTTVTLGVNNIFDLDPPFGAGAFENGYDESTFDIKGRFWYVALKKRF